MGLPSNTNALQNGFAQGYQIGRSLRFRSSASAYLNRTPSSTGNQTIWTWSAWAKRGALSSSYFLFSQGSSTLSTNVRGQFYFNSSDQLQFISVNSANVTDASVNTSAVFRDPSAWYHVVLNIDTSQATGSNRIKIYINGVQQTLTFSTTPTQNASLGINTTQIMKVAADYQFAQSFDGYLAEVNFINGQALTPSSFGLYDSNGIWQPIKYTGTYGTNGFYLPFSNTTSTTTLVADASGNGNNWTANNISLTSGATYDSMLDSPTNSSASSNYAVLNPLARNTSNGILSNGNLSSSGANGLGNTVAEATIRVQNKVYIETTAASGFTLSGSVTAFGFGREGVVYTSGQSPAAAGGVQIGVSSGSWAVSRDSGAAVTTMAAFAGISAGTVIGIAYDPINGNIWVAKNGVWYNSGDPATGVNPTLTGISPLVIVPIQGAYVDLSNTCNFDVNFGQRPFSYTPPTGFNALNTANLPQPLISNGANYMAATLYTGTGATQSISNAVNGVSFQPDFVWIKNRNNNAYHWLTDSVRGITNYLSSNDTIADQSASDAVTALNSNGFTLGVNTSGTYTTGGMNYNGRTFVGWQWKAGAGTTSTNTSGSITSTVSVSAQSGFSIATYTGTGANATVGHGLGVAPSMVIVKERNAVRGWPVYHSGLTSATYFVDLQTTQAQTSAATVWNSTAPTSSVFSIGTDTGTNQSTGTYVAYCFAAVRGYSAFGSYTGNGSSDGPFIFTGHRPRWVMVKKSSAIGNWLIFDTSRSPFNVNDDALFPNLSNAETTTSSYNNDFLSNGFKIRTSDGSWNDSGVTYIYASFAENPFQIARAR